MKFYDVNGAPSPRRVRIVLVEKGIEYETVPVDTPNKAHLEADFLSLIPGPLFRYYNWTTAPASAKLSHAVVT